MGPTDKDAFEVQLVADRISVQEPSGWMPPDREISRRKGEKAHADPRRPLLLLRDFLPVHACSGVCLHFADANTEA